MNREITMPQLGFTMLEGTIVQWRKREGETMVKGEPLLEVSTEKVSIDVEAPVSGTIQRILVPEGSTVPVGTAICVVATVEVESPAPAAPGVTVVAEAPAQPSRTVATPGLSPVAPSPRVRASGVARRLARERGVDLASLGLSGSGPGGRILGADVLACLDKPGPALMPGHSAAPEAVDVGSPAAAAPAPQGAGVSGRMPPAGLASTSIPFAGTRRLTADRMSRSVHDAAQVTLVAEVDATEAMRLRAQLLPEWEKSDGVRLTFTDLIVRACGKALREHPAMNATLRGEEILRWQEVNVGVAVALENGLIVPVIRGADSKGLLAIAAESRDLVDRAGRGALSPDDVSGGTFTVTNLGGYGIDLFTPIINPPETAILGVGRVAERPAVHDGEICKRSLLYLSLTFDHRLVDGAPAALFLSRLRELLESPYRLLS